MLLTFFSPNSGDLCLDPQKPDHRNWLFYRNWELYTRDPAPWGWLPRLSAPNMCTHIPKMFPLNWNGCKCLSCRILSTQAAMGYTPARVLSPAQCGSSQQGSFRCRVWLNWQLGQRSQLLKCKCIQKGGERKPSRTNPPEFYLHDRWVSPYRKPSPTPIIEAHVGLHCFRDIINRLFKKIPSGFFSISLKKLGE